MTPTVQDDWLTMYLGDCREVLAAMPAESVQTVVTSPPYFGLRDYGIPPPTWSDGWLGSLGLEPDPALYIQHLVEVFRAVRRVLRSDGTVWLNLGDSYADRVNRRSDGQSFRADRADVVPPKRNNTGASLGLKAKDRMMMPARVALALQADGWWLREGLGRRRARLAGRRGHRKGGHPMILAVLWELAVETDDASARPLTDQFPDGTEVRLTRGRADDGTPWVDTWGAPVFVADVLEPEAIA